MNLKFFKGAKRLREIMQGPKKNNNDDSESYESDDNNEESSSEPEAFRIDSDKSVDQKEKSDGSNHFSSDQYSDEEKGKNDANDGMSKVEESMKNEMAK